MKNKFKKITTELSKENYFNTTLTVFDFRFKKRVVNKKFSCYSCGKVLRNNLRLVAKLLLLYFKIIQVLLQN